MSNLIDRCPSCGSNEMEFSTDSDTGSKEMCLTCGYITNYVRFSPCGHCFPDVYQLCQTPGCTGTPTAVPCPYGGKAQGGQEMGETA
jgi:hypothetical protein